jgi:hypothetical protein
MAASDSTVDFSGIDATLVISDGSGNSITVSLVQADGGWTIEGDTYTEGRTRNLHRSTPVLRRTGSGNITGSVSANIASFRGSTAATLYEVLRFAGLASSWTTTAAGDKKALRFVWTYNASSAGGATQTVTHNYCVPMNVKFDPVGSDGLGMISFDWTNHESSDTVA